MFVCLYVCVNVCVQLLTFFNVKAGTNVLSTYFHINDIATCDDSTMTSEPSAVNDALIAF